MSPQNPDLDSEALLALPLTQLVQKLQRGELSPEAALFTYVGKVRPRIAWILPLSAKAGVETWPGVSLSEGQGGSTVPGSTRSCVRERE